MLERVLIKERTINEEVKYIQRMDVIIGKMLKLHCKWFGLVRPNRRNTVIFMASAG